MEYRSDQAYLWTRPNVSEIPYHVKLTNPTEDSWWADEDWGKCQCTRKCWEGHSSKMTFPKQAVSLTGITPFLGRVPLKRLFTRQQRDPEDPCCSLTKVKIDTQGHGSLFFLIQGVNVFDWTFQEDVRFTFETACVVPGKVVPLHEVLKKQTLKTVPPEHAVIQITQFFSSNCLQCGKPGAKRLVRVPQLHFWFGKLQRGCEQLPPHHHGRGTQALRRRSAALTRPTCPSPPPPPLLRAARAAAVSSLQVNQFLVLRVTLGGDGEDSWRGMEGGREGWRD